MNFEYGSESFWENIIGTFFVLFIIILIIALATIIVEIIGTYKVYKKAGKSGWEAIVPVYNKWVLCEIAGVEKWFFILMVATSIVSVLEIRYLEDIAPLISVGASFFCNYNIAKKFGKDGYGYALGLTLLPFIFFPILGFGSSKFEDVPVSKYGPISDGTNNSMNSNSNITLCPKCGATINENEAYCTRCGEKIN